MNNREAKFIHILFLCIILPIFLTCCSKDEPQQETNTQTEVVKPDSNTATETLYADDIDRLTKITATISRISGSNLTAIFGIDDGSPGPLLSIDYALFDRLSDDGLAVLIAEKIARRLSGQKMQSSINRKNSKSDNTKTLKIFQQAGRYVAAAGFKEAGFEEWFNSRALSAEDHQQNDVSAALLKKAFMQGYLSAGNTELTQNK